MDARIEIGITLMRELKGANLSVNNLSATVNLAPSRLREIFKRDTGVSPAKYLRNLRMQRAEELLIITTLPSPGKVGLNAVSPRKRAPNFSKCFVNCSSSHRTI